MFTKYNADTRLNTEILRYKAVEIDPLKMTVKKLVGSCNLLSAKAVAIW
ncbi:hypothetical protein A2U01_0026246, partial [Trifolium medium]|nr:hypothetical protein [Trifolium medium]